MSDLEQICIRRIAESKAIPLSSVTLDTTLESLTIDSLDLISLSFDLEEEYGVEVPESKLHVMRTVRDVSIAVQDEVSKKSIATDTRSLT